jgi:hypothetical protein
MLLSENYGNQVEQISSLQLRIHRIINHMSATIGLQVFLDEMFCVPLFRLAILQP